MHYGYLLGPVRHGKPKPLLAESDVILGEISAYGIPIQLFRCKESSAATNKGIDYEFPPMCECLDDLVSEGNRKSSRMHVLIPYILAAVAKLPYSHLTLYPFFCSHTAEMLGRAVASSLGRDVERQVGCMDMSWYSCG